MYGTDLPAGGAVPDGVRASRVTRGGRRGGGAETHTRAAGYPPSATPTPCARRRGLAATTVLGRSSTPSTRPSPLDSKESPTLYSRGAEALSVARCFLRRGRGKLGGLSAAGSPMNYRFAQLSDIHFGQEDKDGSLVIHDLVRDGVLKDCRTFVKDHGPATGILITGDTAYAGKAAEYKIATEWLEKLTAACGCKETDVLTIPGNHDCDVAAISYQAKLLHGQLRASTAEVVQATLHGIAKDGEAANPFLPKLAAYRQFANGYGCDFESPERPIWIREFDLPGKITLRLMGLTSVLVSDLDDDEGKMVLGNRQYAFAEDENIISVVLIHHPLSWFIDKVEATRILSANARLIMMGHEHLLNIQKTTDELAQKEHLVIYSGAVNPPEKGGEYKYTYNWIELSCREINNAHHLVIKVFPRVWVSQRVRFEADRNRLGGTDDFREIVIACPHVHPVSDESSPQAATVKAQRCDPGPHVEGNAAPSKDEPSAAPEPAAQGRSAMKTDSAAFDRLRYLFWRHLDWRQRLKVLVDMNALPETADQQLPQTLERLALEAVQKSGKLHELWDAMMPLIPAEKQAANPFPPRDE